MSISIKRETKHKAGENGRSVAYIPVNGESKTKFAYINN